MSARQLLLLGGLTLAILGMSYGWWYAVFAEHQALDGIGRSLSSGFQAAAQRNSVAADQALLEYREAKYVYDRQVDVHGHWIGLAMLLIVLAVGFDHVGFSEAWKLRLAWFLFLGSVIFPLGVWMQTWSHGPIPKTVTILGSILVITSLGGIVVGVFRQETDSFVVDAK
jgi:hypothetical protein